MISSLESALSSGTRIRFAISALFLQRWDAASIVEGFRAGVKRGPTALAL
jgi:hypothetical protein